MFKELKENMKMSHQIKTINEIEMIKKKETDGNSGMKTTSTEINNSLKELSRRCGQAEEKLSKLEGRSIADN